MNDRINRFEACLLGLALGDALGAPLRGMKDGHIRQTAGAVDGFIDPLQIFPREPRRWRLRGLYGLPAQLALLVCELLIDGQHSAAAFVAKLQQLAGCKLDSQQHLGALRAGDAPLRKALQRINAAERAPGCGEAAPGLLPAALIAPAGLYFRDQPEALGRFVVQIALPLDCDPRAVAGAFAVAQTIALLTREENAADKTFAWLADLIAHARAFEERIKEECWEQLDPQTRISGAHQVSAALSVLPALLREKNDGLAERSILREVNRSATGGEIKSANIDFAPAAAPFALYHGLAHDSFPQGLLKVIRAGRETQLLGAIAGAVLGLRRGLEEIPAEWLAALRNVEQFRQRGRILAGNTDEISLRDNLIANELEWTRREIAHFAEPLKNLAADAEYQNAKRGARAKKRAAEKSAANKQAAPDAGQLPFAPPPQVWIAGGAELDPLARKREKQQRAKRRIGWKEQRRRDRRQSPDNPAKDKK